MSTGAGVEVEYLSQIHQGDGPISREQDIRRLQVGSVDFNDFRDVDHRDCEQLLPHPHQERLEDRERRREAKKESRTAAAGGFHLDASPEGFNACPHDVEADATTGYLGHGRGRGQARQEEEADHLLRRECLRLGDRQEPPSNRDRPDLVHVDPLAVVIDLQHYPIGLAPARERDRPCLGLTELGARRRSFDAIEHGVSQKVDQWLADVVEDRPIELDLVAADD